MSWIPLPDKYPPYETDVLCKRMNGLPPIVCGLFDGEFRDWRDIKINKITHWMPLPENSYSSVQDGKCEKFEMEESVWVRDDESTINITMLLCESHFNGPITTERVSNWTDEECKAVEDYCLAVHIQASDNDDYPVPQKPSVLEHAYANPQAKLV